MTIAPSGTDSAIRRQRRPKRFFIGLSDSLSSSLLEQLGLPEAGSNVTVELPTAELKIETFAPTVKVSGPDGREVPKDEVAEALRNIMESQDTIVFAVGKVRKWQVRHTIISVLTFVGGAVAGQSEKFSELVRWVREILNATQ